MSPTGLPWSNPDCDPMADLQAYIRLSRESADYIANCSCSWCVSRDNLPYSIYGPGQQPLTEEQMSPDAARWSPSLAEEEKILEDAKALLARPQAASPVSTS